MTERRTRLLLVLLVLGQLLLVSAQVPTSGGQQSVLSGMWLRGTAPFAAAVDTVANGIAGFAVHWTTRRRLLVDKRAPADRERGTAAAGGTGPRNPG